MVSESSTSDPATTGTQSLFDTLAVVLDNAISLQPVTESIMRSCLVPGPKDATLARKAGRVKDAFMYLSKQVEGMPSSEIIDDARRLLLYHHRLLAETVDFAYSANAVLNPRSSLSYSDHLGEPAARLRRLRGRLAAYSSDTGLPEQFSHSLRTPLTTILGNASSLLQPEVDWDRNSEHRMLREIMAESSRLARAVDNILNLASMRAGTLRPDFDWSDPLAIVRAAVSEVDPTLSPDNRIAVAPDLPAIWAPTGFIWADHNLLTRAILNVFDNALRHNPPSTRVTLTGSTDDEHITISVRDDGRGLPGAVANVIAKAMSTDSLPTEIGTGIPTTIGLIAAHGGRVSLTSTGSGTRCTIQLPRDSHIGLRP